MDASTLSNCIVANSILYTVFEERGDYPKFAFRPSSVGKGKEIGGELEIVVPLAIGRHKKWRLSWDDDCVLW